MLGVRHQGEMFAHKGILRVPIFRCSATREAVRLQGNFSHFWAKTGSLVCGRHCSINVISITNLVTIIVFKILLLFILFSLVKAIVPRYRYDQLMKLGWKIFLPFSLIWLILTSSYLFYFNLLPVN